MRFRPLAGALLILPALMACSNSAVDEFPVAAGNLQTSEVDRETEAPSTSATENQSQEPEPSPSDPEETNEQGGLQDAPDANRGRALLQAYGAYSAGNGHTVVGDMQRIMSDLALVVQRDLPEIPFLQIVESASERLAAYLETGPELSDPASRIARPSFDDTPTRGDGYPDSLPVELNRGRTLLDIFGAYETDPPAIEQVVSNILVDLGLVLIEDDSTETLLAVAKRAFQRL